MLTARVLALCVPAIMSASCVANTAADAGGTATVENRAQPRMSSYNCADGGRITIENLGSLVRVVDADGTGMELPAAPATQRSRYGEGADAIVIEGREVLLMRGGKTPQTCTR